MNPPNKLSTPDAARFEPGSGKRWILLRIPRGKIKRAKRARTDGRGRYFKFRMSAYREACYRAQAECLGLTLRQFVDMGLFYHTMDRVDRIIDSNTAMRMTKRGRKAFAARLEAVDSAHRRGTYMPSRN